MAKKFKILLIMTALLLITFVVWVLWANTALELNSYTIRSAKIPEKFSGFRIAQVSDLHNAQMGKNNQKLIQMLHSANPDVIVITGDIVDVHKTDLDVALDFAAQAVSIAPCYYVTGNNEAYLEEYSQLEEGLSQIGVTALNDTAQSIKQNDAQILLIGVNDPAFRTDYVHYYDEDVMRSALDAISCNEDSFRLLLSHRPELFSIYEEYGFDLVLSGHVHGGQFRLPFIGGVYGPHQGFLPEFDAGLYSSNNTSMIVSRGIGNSRFPLRFNNRPEVILIELKPA